MEGINFPAGSKEWQKFEKNNDTIVWYNILYVEQNKKKLMLYLNQNITINIKNN